MTFLQRLLNQTSPFRIRQPTKPQDLLPLSYSWILTNQLAIGPMPRYPAHWQQLEDAGFRTRFSCCYSEEEQISQIPDQWRSLSIALPDHRQQEELTTSKLKEALLGASGLIKSEPPVYLHCFAGRERSSLMAVGLTAQARDMDVFAALAWVRRCHPAAMPIYDHLDLLDRILREMG